MKQITLFLLLLIVFDKLNAQNQEKKNTFGIITGISASSITNYDGKLLLGFTGGLYWEWKFSKRFALMSNFLYIQKGEKEDDINIDGLRLDYVNMPMMLKYYGTTRLSFLTGINSDLLIGVSGNKYEKEDLKKTDWGVPIGISYDLPNNFQLGMTCNFGLTDVVKSNNNSGKLRNNFENLTLTYLFK
jgi:hypothetical protein